MIDLAYHIGKKQNVADQHHFSQDELSRLQVHMQHAHPQEILRWAHDYYGEKLLVVTSFQATGIVTLHMLRQFTDNVQVATLDTGLLFPETYQLIEDVEAALNISVKRIKPTLSLSAQTDKHGASLWETDPDKCCHLRKTIPLRDALKNYDAWVTGLRRDQSITRRNIPVLDWDERYDMLKLMPFAHWTEDMLWTYINAYDLPYNPLHDRGYPSIGCHTCTVAGNGREGRWSNSGKTECGIHVPFLTAENLR